MGNKLLLSSMQSEKKLITCWGSILALRYHLSTTAQASINKHWAINCPGSGRGECRVGEVQRFVFTTASSSASITHLRLFVPITRNRWWAEQATVIFLCVLAWVKALKPNTASYRAGGPLHKTESSAWNVVSQDTLGVCLLLQMWTEVMGLI